MENSDFVDPEVIRKVETRQVTYWMTRDSANGVLSEFIDVWLVKPDLQRTPDGDVFWISPYGLSDRCTEWTPEEAKHHAYVYPETNRECIKVEGKE